MKRAINLYKNDKATKSQQERAKAYFVKHAKITELVGKDEAGKIYEQIMKKKLAKSTNPDPKKET